MHDDDDDPCRPDICSEQRGLAGRLAYSSTRRVTERNIGLRASVLASCWHTRNTRQQTPALFPRAVPIPTGRPGRPTQYKRDEQWRPHEH
jgi:hypothetical protein